MEKGFDFLVVLYLDWSTGKIPLVIECMEKYENVRKLNLYSTTKQKLRKESEIFRSGLG